MNKMLVASGDVRATQHLCNKQARQNPDKFISVDPFGDAWGPTAGRPPMLYLDKCWQLLEELTRPQIEADPRPAYRLFEGDVACDSDQLGWYPWIRVLDADEIAEIAHDIAEIAHDIAEIAHDIVLLDDEDIRAMIATHPAFQQAEDYGNLRHDLTDAQTFVTDLAADGSGVVYMIG
jgi:hypothetical protein